MHEQASPKNTSHSKIDFCKAIILFLEILFVTLWLAGALLLAEHRGWLDGLDNLMFAHAVDVSHEAKPAPDAKSSTLVVKISRSYYETEFHERSPLDPRVLDQIVKVIASGRPSQLAIDLDLSPSPSDADLIDAVAARETMVERLKLLATQGARVLIVLPGVSSTLAEQARKAEWASALCQAGMELADPNLGLSHTPAGLSLLKYVESLPSLGVLMGPKKQSGLCASRNEAGKIPTLMLAPNSAAASLMNATDSIERRRINFKGFEEPKIFSIETPQDIHGLSQLLDSLKPKTIVLAGNFSEADTFQLPNGRTVSGAEVHAAVAYSIHEPVEPSHGWAYLLDLVLGVTVGLALHWLWHRYKDTRFLYAKALYLFGAFAVFALPVVLLLYWMPYLLTINKWINAIPLLIGLFIHGIMEPLHTEEPTEAHGVNKVPCSFPALWNDFKKHLFEIPRRKNSIHFCAPYSQKFERGAEKGSKFIWLLFRSGFALCGLYMVFASMIHH